MDRKQRDRKRKQQAIERVRTATQGFEKEIRRSEQVKGYEPDLDDLEALSRYFEGVVKCMKKLNDKAIKKKGHMWEESEDETSWIRMEEPDSDRA